MLTHKHRTSRQHNGTLPNETESGVRFRLLATAQTSNLCLFSFSAAGQTRLRFQANAAGSGNL